MPVLYRISIWFYAFIIKVLAPFNEKAKQFSNGRKGWRKSLSDTFNKNESKVVWFHAASLGEFEQGRPVIEELKKSNPDVKVLLTFFSPSGYEIKKDYEFADWVFYLPMDSPSNARFFVETVKPTIVVFIKYEFWYYFLSALKNRNIPIVMVSGIFRENQLFFHWAAGPFYQKILKTFHHFFVQDEKSKKLIEPYVGNHVTVAGDTRFDRVISIAKEAKEIEIVEKFKGSKRLMVIGSSWHSDMTYLLPLIEKYQSKIQFVIAPHNIDEPEIQRLESTLQNTTRFSSGENGLETADILIIDNIGMLSSIYRYADFTFIGGAFRGALHNTLEAAVYGVPVCFGEHENNKKFMEAIELVKHQGGFTFSSSVELLENFDRLVEDSDHYDHMCQSSRTFVESRSGATSLVISKILELLS